MRNNTHSVVVLEKKADSGGPVQHAAEDGGGLSPGDGARALEGPLPVHAGEDAAAETEGHEGLVLVRDLPPMPTSGTFTSLRR